MSLHKLPISMSWSGNVPNFAGSSGEKVSSKAYTHFVYMLFRIDPVSSHRSLRRNGSRALENPIRRGNIYDSLCCKYSFTFVFLQYYHMIFHLMLVSKVVFFMFVLGNCVFRDRHCPPNMVYSQRWPCICCCLPAPSDPFGSYNGNSNSSWSIVLWRVSRKISQQIDHKVYF